MELTLSTPIIFRHPALEYNKDSRFWRLVRPYQFVWDVGVFQKRITIPAGFEYDKASVPRRLWCIARPDGPWEAAALLHDRFYLFKGKLPAGEFETFVDGEWYPDPSPWTRKQADQLLKYMGYLGGASEDEAYLYYCAVRLWPENWLKGF